MISILGIIPARGGSKRLPGKNLMKIGGMSLLEITIRQAKKALPVSVVTSDHTAIIIEANRCGMKALLRPDELATDEATSADVVNHVLGIYPGFDLFCLLQVTSPLRLVSDITTCVEMSIKTGLPVISTFRGKPNGAIYIHDALRFKGDFWSKAIHYEMPEERSVDIDTLEDFKRAEDLYGKLVRATPASKVLQEVCNLKPTSE